MCPARRKQPPPDLWSNVGVHPTPGTLVDAFVKFATAKSESFAGQNAIRILDAFAGDGRLGHAVASKLASLGYSVELDCIEVDTRIASQTATSTTYRTNVYVQNAFAPTSGGYDLVVSNPPYLAMHRVRTEQLGFDWEAARLLGANLYCLAIVRCLEFARAGGEVLLIAPYGWVNNRRCDGLRTAVASETAQVEVLAFNDRNLFPNVSQDISFQAFTKDTKPNKRRRRPRIMFSQMGEPLKKAPPQAMKGTRPAVQARVGPLVWNRSRELLQSAKAKGILVINGGNIGRDGTLDTSKKRYMTRQYARASDVPASYISSGPVLLIKRTMRGGPGSWVIDSALVQDDKFRCVAENHVIVVQLTEGTARATEQYCSRLLQRLHRAHALHGHPNVSAELVSQTIGRMTR
jgi:hypothetical protein